MRRTRNSEIPSPVAVAATALIVEATVSWPMASAPRSLGLNVIDKRLAAQVRGCVLRSAAAPWAMLAPTGLLAWRDGDSWSLDSHGPG
jgi:hypothetical protein